jgi:hypothetical protein
MKNALRQKPQGKTANKKGLDVPPDFIFLLILRQKGA